MNSIFTIVPQFLKNPTAFYESVQRNEDLRRKALSLFTSALLFFMTYGFVTGLGHGHQGYQAISSAIKMPALFLLTLGFTLPALYFFALALLHVQFSVAQASVVVLAGMGVTAFLLLGLSPVTLFFVLTSSNYSFFKLLAVLFVAISGFTGLFYVLRGFTWVEKDSELTRSSIGKTLLRAWVALYGFVGAQMAWRLSPMIGDPDQDFYILRPSRDNFFMDVLNSIQAAMGTEGTGLALHVDTVIIAAGIALTIALVIGVLRSLGRYGSIYIPSSQDDSGDEPI